MLYVQCEIGGLYCLAPKGVCSRGVQAGCEKGLSPKSRFCVVGRALLATLHENSLGVVVFLCVAWSCLGCEPWLPFYSLKGAQDFTCVSSDLALVSGEATAPTLLRLAHPVLEVWLTVWLFLWRVAETC